MSHIFDALQRSETERLGPDAQPAAATELLERAERQTASKWDSSASSAKADANYANFDLTFGQRDAAATPVLERTAGTEVTVSGDLAGVFSQFRPVEVSLPFQTRLVSLAASETPAAEAFRLLGVRLRHLRSERTLKKLLITSTTPQEGKSLVAANLACTLASGTKQRVLLLDGDLRRPSLTGVFGLSEIPGACEYLQGKRSAIASVYRLQKPDIWIMPAGNPSANPLELMQPRKLSGLMEQLSAWFDWIVIDSPPVAPLADASIWARLSDGILLVTRTGQTKKRQLLRGLEGLDPGKLVGALLNSSQSSDESGYDYYRRPRDPAAAGETVQSQ